MELRLFEASIFRTMALFPWICFSQTLLFFTPDFSNPRFFETPDFRTNSRLPWKKFISNLPSISRTRRKELLSSFRLNGHTSRFYSQTQKVEPPQSIKQ